MPLAKSNKTADSRNTKKNEIDKLMVDLAQTGTFKKSSDTEDVIAPPVTQIEKQQNTQKNNTLKTPKKKETSIQTKLDQRKTIYFSMESLIDLQELRVKLLKSGINKNISELVEEAIPLLMKKYNQA